MRKPYVAGSFYPHSREEIGRMLDGFSRDVKPFKGDVKACVVPHAGWVYSGRTAMHSFLSLKKADVFVVLSPNHSGRGAMVSVSFNDWETPLGVVKTDEVFASALVEASALAKKDEEAHALEHSIEVQLPFLQHLFESFSFVGVTIMKQDAETARDLAEALAAAEKKTGKRIAVIASSDFTHYEPAKQAKAKDLQVIEAIEALDVESFFERVDGLDASVCGFCPVGAAMEYARLKGAKKGVLLDFSNSGEVTGDANVVDYASIVFL